MNDIHSPALPTPEFGYSNFIIKFVNTIISRKMNQRLQQLINAEGLTQSQFADKIGVAKASVSHILAGRNKPGFDFIESLSRQFPNLSLEWLISGKGRMYKVTGPETAPPEAPQDPGIIAEIPTETEEARQDRPTIVKVVVFYDNGTFQELV